jgi:hypothetical protein
MHLPDARGPEEDDVFVTLDEAQRMQVLELFARNRRLKAEIEIAVCKRR